VCVSGHGSNRWIRRGSPSIPMRSNHHHKNWNNRSVGSLSLFRSFFGNHSSFYCGSRIGTVESYTNPRPVHNISDSKLVQVHWGGWYHRRRGKKICCVYIICRLDNIYSLVSFVFAGRWVCTTCMYVRTCTLGHICGWSAVCHAFPCGRAQSRNESRVFLQQDVF
jgi:hypothetical protein